MAVDQISKEINTVFRERFNELQYKTYVALHNYHVTNNEWPTSAELAHFLDIDKDNIKPRLSELHEQHLVLKAEKRPCRKLDHNRDITTWKLNPKFREKHF